MARGSFELESSDSRLAGLIEWSSVSNGPSANTSTVTATLYVSRNDTYTTTGTWEYGFNVGGSTEFDSVYESVSGDWVAVSTISKTVAHNPDGTGSCYIEGYVIGPDGTSLAGESVSGSQTVTLDRIPRYTSITSFSVAKRNETSVTYSFTTADTCDYAYYSTNDGSSWTGVDIADGTSGSFNVTGLSPNTTYNFKLKVRRKDSGLETISNRVQQTTYKVPSQSLNSKTETSITMNWSVDSTADYIWYSKDNGSNWTAVGSVNATSGSYTISNLTANTSYNIKTRVRRKTPQTTYDTTANNQTTHNFPYVSAIGSNPLIIGNSQTLTLYNPLNRSVTVKMNQNNASGTQLYSGTTNSTSITFTPNASTLYASIPNSPSGNCVYSVIYGSSTKTTGTNTYQITGNEKPTFSNFTYADTNANTTALTGNNQILVNGYSNVTTTISVANKATPKNSTTMKDYTLSIGNKSAQVNYSDNSDVTMSVTAVNSGTIKVTANDNRGLGTIVEKTATFKDYSKPVVKSLIAARGNNGVGESVTLSFSGTWWNDSFGSVANSITSINYYFRKSTTQTWTTGSTTITATTSNNNFSGSVAVAGDTQSSGFDAASSYYIKIVVTDQLDHSEEYQTTIGSGTPAIAVYKDNVAIGQQYDTDLGGKLQVNGDIKAKFYTPLFYNLDLSSLSTSNFYPITFPKGEADIPLDCEIHSPNVAGSSAYNQNVIHFRIITNGWADTPPLFNIFEYGVFATNEITIGCIGRSTERIGTKKEGECIWLRGGLNYRFVSNFKPVLHTSNYSPDTNVTYSVGTNYYGGTNTSVSILFTPNSTLTGNGGYFSGKSNTANTATKATQDSDGNAINSTYLKLAGGTVTGNVTMSSGDLLLTKNATSGGQQIKWSLGANDYARVYGAATASNAGYLEIATGDDTNEPIYVRQYSGNFATVSRTVTLLDGSGNTTFPGTVKVNGSVEVQQKPTSLYENSSGNTGTVTLSQSAANFTYIEIFYLSTSDSNVGYSLCSTKAWGANGKGVWLSTGTSHSVNMNIKLASVLVNGTSISKSYGYMEFDNDRKESTNYIGITKVLGWK